MQYKSTAFPATLLTCALLLALALGGSTQCEYESAEMATDGPVLGDELPCDAPPDLAVELF
ncbi:MAG: hypothetical protein KJZ78_28060, partial [Bryobacteraceae bacterium]|nr:hypothetical protein [Bryobacteraceae bacterium]